MKMAMEAISLPVGAVPISSLRSWVPCPLMRAHHLVAFGYLILDDEADVGEGGDELGNLALVGLAVRAVRREVSRG